MSDDGQKLDRRAFLRRAGFAGLVAAGAGSFAASCKKEDSSEGGGSGSQGGGGGSGELSCNDTSDLTEGEKQTRKNLKYVDKSEKPDQNCANCNLYEPPENEGECGGCTVVPGPIHPEGWCSSWAKKQG